MKVYTRTGDEGDTGLFGGTRVSKTHPRVVAYGEVDELNAALGVALALVADAALAARLEALQRRLFDVGADLATPPAGSAGAWVKRVPDAWVAELEAEIDRFDDELPALGSFILPGGTAGAAALHLARTVCRRAERAVVAADEAGEELGPAVARYLNRLSDWLFMAARIANARSGVADVAWRRED